MKSDVFISYSHRDKDVADATCAALEGAGIGCWIAPRDVGPGEYATNIVRAIGECRVFLLVFSLETNQSTQVRKEIERAVSKDRMIIPLRVEDAKPAEALEYYLSDVHWMDAFPPPLDEHLQRLAVAVKAVLSPDAPRARQPPPSPARRRGQAGWPVKLAAGLVAFGAVVVLLWALLPRLMPQQPATTTVAVQQPPVPVRPANPLQAQSSTSDWKGTYYYPDNNKPPVPFDMTLQIMDSRISGVVKEAATFGAGNSPYLYARVAGMVIGSRITFVKSYDGTDSQVHDVDYEGDISADGTRITGQYYVRVAGYSGTFEASLK